MDVSGAFAAISFAKNVFTNLLQLKIDTVSLGKIHEALSKLGAAHDAMFALREKLSDLQDKNERLKGEVKALADWETRKAAYKLVTTAGGSIIWEFQGEPKYYACPVCLESKKEIHPLQGNTWCKNCNSRFAFNPHTPPTRRGGNSIDPWINRY